MHTEQSLLSELKNMGIEFEYISHPAVFTCTDANAAMPEMHGAHCKNLFVRDRAHKKYLLVIPDDRRADLKSISQKIGANGHLSFCSADEMVEFLGVTPGSATPMAMINDTANAVDLVVDTAIIKMNPIHCHPMINTATIGISPTDFQKFIAATNHELRVMDL